MALPCGTTGSLYPTFVPAWLVGLTVKLAYAIALYVRLPSVLSEPLKASDTLSEATTPVKLPTKQCPPLGVRLQISEGWYFTFRLHESWRSHFKASHLFYTSLTRNQC
jgi:hypothetical protein